MRIAVIPARGGSKRIPRKNIKPFFGKPMIAWSIEAANKSGCFDRIMVSTDDDEIAEVARSYGAEVPFMRPEKLSGDYAGTIAVVAHAILWCQQQNIMPTAVCCIYATAPLLSGPQICRGLEAFEGNNCDFSLSVTSYALPIQRAIKVTVNGRLQMNNSENYNIRSQDLEEAFHDAGQFYWGSTDAWLNNTSVFTQNSIPVIIPRYLVQDIDTPEDWTRAEFMFEVIKKTNAEN